MTLGSIQISRAALNVAVRLCFAILLIVAAIFAVTVLVYGMRVRVGAADSSYYPRVLAAVENASPPERGHLLRLWASETPEGYYGFITPFELHHVLWHADYCTNLLGWPGCKPLPMGNEDQGIAKERLDRLSIPYRN